MSRMDFHHDFILKTLNSNKASWLEIMEQSYWFHQRAELKKRNEKEILPLKVQIEKVDALLPEATKALVEKKLHLENQVRILSHGKQKRARDEYNALIVNSTDISNYHTLQEYKNELKELEEYALFLEDHKGTVEGPLTFLRTTGYLKEDTTDPLTLSADSLTTKGILATEVNEGNSILMTELFLSKKAHELAGAELAALLSVFMEDFDRDSNYNLDELSVPKAVKEVALYMNDESYRLADLEAKCKAFKTESAWFLSLQWMELVYRWITEETHIAILCSEYNTFEGNVVRGILKLVNLLDEWLSMATYCSEASQIEKITALKPLLMRDIVVPNSLYLTKA